MKRPCHQYHVERDNEETKGTIFCENKSSESKDSFLMISDSIIISYHIVSYHIISYHVILYQISYRAIFALILRFCPCPSRYSKFLFLQKVTRQWSFFPSIGSLHRQRRNLFFKRTVKSKVKNHGKFIFWHLQVRFPFFHQTLYIQMLFFCNYINSPFFNPTILQGIDVWKDLRLSCWGHWGNDQISHPWFNDTCRSGRYVAIHPMLPTTVVQMPLNPDTFSTFNEWFWVFCVCMICWSTDWCPIFQFCKAAVIRDLPRQEQLNGDEVGMFGLTTRIRQKKLYFGLAIFWLLNILLND